MAAWELDQWRWRPARRAHGKTSAATRASQELFETGVEDFCPRYPGTLCFDYGLPTAAPW